MVKFIILTFALFFSLLFVMCKVANVTNAVAFRREESTLELVWHLIILFCACALWAYYFTFAN